MRLRLPLLDEMVTSGIRIVRNARSFSVRKQSNLLSSTLICILRNVDIYDQENPAENTPAVALLRADPTHFYMVNFVGKII